MISLLSLEFSVRGARNGFPRRRAVRTFEHLADFALAFVRRSEDRRMHVHEATAELDRLFARSDLDDGETADHLLRFGKRPIRDMQLPARHAHPGTPRGGGKTSRLKQHAGALHVGTKLSDGSH